MVQAVEVGVQKLPDVHILQHRAFLEPRVDHAVAPVEVEFSPVCHEEQMAKRPAWIDPE